MTSAYANKVLKKLKDDKNYYLNKEEEGQVYVAAIDEEPVIPDYDYEEISARIAEIDDKIVKIKHTINVVNATNKISVGDSETTVDTILIRMAQLNNRKSVLDKMRKRQKKTREKYGVLNVRKTAPEYQYLNYDLKLVSSEYERIDSEIAAMQMALDKFNQTFEFDVEY